MSNNAGSAHGTLIAKQPGGVGSFTTVAELRDITPPPLTRKSIETSSQNEDDDTFVVGMRRRGELSVQIGFIPSGQTTGVESFVKSWYNGTKDGWRITYPDGTMWIFSGYVTNVAPKAPTDDGLVAEVQIRPTGAMSFT